MKLAIAIEVNEADLVVMNAGADEARGGAVIVPNLGLIPALEQVRPTRYVNTQESYCRLTYRKWPLMQHFNNIKHESHVCSHFSLFPAKAITEAFHSSSNLLSVHSSTLYTGSAQTPSNAMLQERRNR